MFCSNFFLVVDKIPTCDQLQESFQGFFFSFLFFLVTRFREFSFPYDLKVKFLSFVLTPTHKLTLFGLQIPHLEYPIFVTIVSTFDFPPILKWSFPLDVSPVVYKTMPRHEMKDTTDVVLLGSFHLSGST